MSLRSKDSAESVPVALDETLRALRDRIERHESQVAEEFTALQDALSRCEQQFEAAADTSHDEPSTAPASSPKPSQSMASRTAGCRISSTVETFSIWDHTTRWCMSRN